MLSTQQLISTDIFNLGVEQILATYLNMAEGATEPTAKLIALDDEETDHADSDESVMTPKQKSASLVLFIYNSVTVSVIYSLLLPFFTQVVSLISRI